jgi:DNA invertase Pin-like site-specific DNA recombinase
MKTRTHEQDATMPRRAYSYTRFSTGKQADGDSERRQTEWPAQVAQEQGWTLDDTLTFIDRGRSGFHGANRKADGKAVGDLARFLDLVERGRITRGSVLIVENLDRLSREDVDTAHDLFRSIIRAGLWICTKTPFRIYKGGKDATFMDLLEPIWICYVAHQESLKKSQRVADAWVSARREARAQGRPHSCKPVAWLRRQGEGYAVIPEKAAAVRRLFALTIEEDLGSVALGHRLAKEGYHGIGPSGRWDVGTVQTIIRGRAVLGEYQPSRRVNGKQIPEGEPIRGYYPAIIDEATWNAAQVAMDRRKGRSGRPGVTVTNLFTGLLIDEASGLRLRVHSKGGRRRRDGSYKKYPYLCTGHSRGTCVRYEDAEACILDTLGMLKTEDVLEPSLRQSEREHQVAALQARVTALRLRLKQLQAAAADLGQDAEPILPALAQVGAEHKAEALRLERLQLECVSGRGEALTETQTLVSYRDRTTGKERAELDRRIKAALPTIIKEIRVCVRRISARQQMTHLRIILHSGSIRDASFGPRPRSSKVVDAAEQAGEQLDLVGT